MYLHTMRQYGLTAISSCFALARDTLYLQHSQGDPSNFMIPSLHGYNIVILSPDMLYIITENMSLCILS